jgi:hypothetical protein
LIAERFQEPTGALRQGPIVVDDQHTLAAPW